MIWTGIYTATRVVVSGFGDGTVHQLVNRKALFV